MRSSPAAPADPLSVPERKRALRAAARARRAALPDEERRAAAQAVAERLAELLPPVAGLIVAGYAPIRDELDPMPALGRLHAGGARLALPVVAGRDRPLLFRRWRPGDPLEPGAFRIPEPLPDSPPAEPDIVLVPLLAFDRVGHRLGYGAGHYDRTLARLRAAKRILAVGLAFAVQEIDRVPVTPDDQPLDRVVTERGLAAGSAA